MTMMIVIDDSAANARYEYDVRNRKHAERIIAEYHSLDGLNEAAPKLIPRLLLRRSASRVYVNGQMTKSREPVFPSKKAS